MIAKNGEDPLNKFRFLEVHTNKSGTVVRVVRAYAPSTWEITSVFFPLAGDPVPTKTDDGFFDITFEFEELVDGAWVMIADPRVLREENLRVLDDLMKFQPMLPDDLSLELKLPFRSSDAHGDLSHEQRMILD